MKGVFVALLLCISVHAHPLHAETKKKPIGKKGELTCPPVIGFKESGQFQKAGNFMCFANRRAAEKAGFVPFTSNSLPPGTNGIECGKPQALPNGLIALDQMYTFEGARIVARNGQFLGILTRDNERADSISNEFGPYGSTSSENSIFNRSSLYGVETSDISAFNVAAQNPPVLIIGSEIVGYLSSNKLLSPRVNPNLLKPYFRLEEY